MPVQPLKEHKVWDVPTRLFHWINFICFVALVAIGTALLFDEDLGLNSGGKVLLKTVHVWFGYVLATNLVIRLLWAFFGNRFARWSAFVPFGRGYFCDLKRYLRGLFSGRAPAYLGHNPVAKAMVFLLLLALFSQAATGLLLAGTDLFFPPFGQMIAGWVAAPGVDPVTLVPYDKTGVDPQAWAEMRAFRETIITIHFWGFFVLLVAAGIHIIGVIATEFLERGSIVSAMITGRKILDRPPVDGDPEKDA